MGTKATPLKADPINMKFGTGTLRKLPPAGVTPLLNRHASGRIEAARQQTAFRA